MTLGKIIHKYREDHDMSMGEFAVKSGLSKSYISLLEKNRHPTTGKPIIPTIMTIQQVAEAIGVSFEKIYSQIQEATPYMEGTEQPYYINEETAKIAQEVFDDPDLKMLLDASRGVSPENVRLAAEMLRRMKETNG